jgi:hypothetical protein
MFGILHTRRFIEYVCFLIVGDRRFLLFILIRFMILRKNMYDEKVFKW